MKTILFTVIAVILSSVPVSAQDTYVDGYVRSDGTYVQPHFRSQADNNLDNNFSTRGNTNPYTGSAGREHPPSLNSRQNENSSHYQPSTRNWNNNRPYRSSYRRPQGGM